MPLSFDMESRMKTATQKRLIYLRYILPPLLVVVMLAAMAIPSYVYVMNGSVEEPASALTLLGNSYDRARQVLFGTAEETAQNIAFSKTVLIVMGLLALLSVAAFVINAWAAYVAVGYFGGNDEAAAEKRRATLCTFVPNRIVLCSCSVLMLAIAAFPYLVPSIYSASYGSSVRVVITLCAPDALILAGVGMVAAIVLSVLCAPAERRLGADIFKKRKPFEKKEEKGEEELPTADIPTISSDEQQRRNERIRRLLSNEKDDNNSKENN